VVWTTQTTKMMTPACESDEGPIRVACEDENLNLEMFILVLLRRQYLSLLFSRPIKQSAITRDKSRKAKRKPAPTQAAGARYTPEEDELLFELKEKRGMPWQEIPRKLFSAEKNQFATGTLLHKGEPEKAVRIGASRV